MDEYPDRLARFVQLLIYLGTRRFDHYLPVCAGSTFSYEEHTEFGHCLPFPTFPCGRQSLSPDSQAHCGLRPLHRCRASRILDAYYIHLTLNSDATALLLASTLPCTSLLAVQVNTPSVYSVRAASALLQYYDHADVPIGVITPGNLTDEVYFDDISFRDGEYASKVAYHWNGTDIGVKDAVNLYRKVLAEQDDGSVTIASIGFLDNVRVPSLFNSFADLAVAFLASQHDF